MMSYSKEHYQKNKEAISKQRHEYWLKNKIKIQKVHEIWSRNNWEWYHKYKLKYYKTRWYPKNKTKMKEYMKEYYKKNRKHQLSRVLTYKVVYGDKFKGRLPTRVIEKYCKKCKINKNLELHHEIYPQTFKEIKTAIDQGKIYYLCYDCHRFTTPK